MTKPEIMEFYHSKDKLSYKELCDIIFWLKEDANQMSENAVSVKNEWLYEGMRQAYYFTLQALEKLNNKGDYNNGK